MHAYIQHAHDAAEARRQRLLREIIGPAREAREAREPGPPAESILGPIGIVALMVISSIALTTLIY